LEVMEEDSKLDRIPEHMEESEGHEHGRYSVQDDDKPADEEDGGLEMMEEISQLQRILELAEEGEGHKQDTHNVQDDGKPAAFEGPREHQHLVQQGMDLPNYGKRKKQVLDSRLTC
jgi:hypothetical protein